MKRLRLDILVARKHPEFSRSYIQKVIREGFVRVNGRVMTKPGALVNPEAELCVDASSPKFVSRAGLKLEHALDHFSLDVTGLVALDAGISTGGFTDCLLQRGIARVYGIDVGHGQVHEKLRDDNRLVLLEKTNLRTLTQLPEKVDLATLDLSFISILKVMPALIKLLKPTGKIIALIKPQFETERADVGRGGVVKDEAVREKVIEKVKAGMEGFGFVCREVIESPILGGAGNKEFLGLFEREL